MHDLGQSVVSQSVISQAAYRGGHSLAYRGALAGQAVAGLDEAADVVEVPRRRGRVVVGRLVDVDALDVEARRRVGVPAPAGVAVNLGAGVGQRLPAVVDAHVADGVDVGEGVEPRHLAGVVFAGQRLRARAAVGVDDDEEVDVGVGRGAAQAQGQSPDGARIVGSGYRNLHLRVVQRLPCGLVQWVVV